MFDTPRQYMYSKFDSDNNPVWICSCGFETKDPFQVTGHVCNDKSELTFDSLQPGTIIQNTGSGNSYIITENCGEYAIAVRTICVHNLQEWKIIDNP